MPSAKAEDAIGTHEWDRAIALLQAAIRKADAARSLDKANLARYDLAFCYYMTKQFLRGIRACRHLRPPLSPGGSVAKATEIGMQCLGRGLHGYAESIDCSDLDRLIDLANYTAETWPDKEQADERRMNLGPDRIWAWAGTTRRSRSLGAVASKSRQWVTAENRLGRPTGRRAANWSGGATPPGPQSEAKTAIELLNAASKARREAGSRPDDPGSGRQRRRSGDRPHRNRQAGGIAHIARPGRSRRRP